MLLLQPERAKGLPRRSTRWVPTRAVTRTNGCHQRRQPSRLADDLVLTRLRIPLNGASPARIGLLQRIGPARRIIAALERRLPIGGAQPAADRRRGASIAFHVRAHVALDRVAIALTAHGPAARQLHPLAQLALERVRGVQAEKAA